MQVYAPNERFAHGTLQFRFSRMKKVVIFVSIFSFLGLASAQSQPNQNSTPNKTTAQTQFITVEQVHPGMKGVAYTVFEGTQPEPMGVEVLGVLKI